MGICSIFFYRYGILWIVPGESSCPNGSEYVLQRGVRGLKGRVTAAEIAVSRFVATDLQC